MGPYILGNREDYEKKIHRHAVHGFQFLSAFSAARDSILRSRADRIKSELDGVSGDVGATWRIAQRLLHSEHRPSTTMLSVRS